MSATSRIRAAISGNVVRTTVLVAISAASSSLITYKIASKRLEAEFAVRLDDELDATRKFYASLNDKPTLDVLMGELGLEPIETTVDQMVREEVREAKTERVTEPTDDPRPDLQPSGKGVLVQYNRVVKNYVGDETVDDESVEAGADEEETVASSSFDREQPVTDNLPQELVDARTPDKPYIITQDEFAETEWGQDTLTFYAADGVLADSQDIPEDKIDYTVGEENLGRFGLGSGDSRVVYVRNEKISMDYEIVLHDGSFAEIVHGIVEETPRKKKAQHREE